MGCNIWNKTGYVIQKFKEAVLKDDFVEDAVVDTCASFDGTWQKRGYASFNGVVTGMSDQGKCIDFEINLKCASHANIGKAKKVQKNI